MKPRKLLPYYVDLFKFYTSRNLFDITCTTKKSMISYYKFLILSKECGYVLEGAEYDFMSKVLLTYNDEFVEGSDIIIDYDNYDYKCFYFWCEKTQKYVDFSLQKSIDLYYTGKFSTRQNLISNKSVLVYLKSSDNDTLHTEKMSLENLIAFLDLTDKHSKVYHKTIKPTENEPKLVYAERLYKELEGEYKMSLDDDSLKTEYNYPKLFVYLAPVQRYTVH